MLQSGDLESHYLGFQMCLHLFWLMTVGPCHRHLFFIPSVLYTPHPLLALCQGGCYAWTLGVSSPALWYYLDLTSESHHQKLHKVAREDSFPVGCQRLIAPVYRRPKPL